MKKGTAFPAGAARYRAIAAALRDAILRGRWAPGAVFPTEARLGADFSVSRITVRQALALLEEEGLIERQRGSGTFVSPHPTRRIPLQIDYTGSIRAHAPRLRRTVLRFVRQPVGPAAAVRLRIAPDAPAFYAERLDRLGRAPVAWDQAYLPAAFADPLTRADLAHVDFLEIWSRRANFRIGDCRQTIEAVAAAAEPARRLRVPPGAPLLRSTERYSTAQGLPAGLFISYYHPAHICITSTYHWSRGAARGG